MRDEIFRCMEAMSELGEPQWFGLGDLATHLLRTRWLRAGPRQGLRARTDYEANASANTLRSFPIHNAVFMAGTAVGG